MNLANKIVVVTGGGGPGIGRAVSLAMARRGAAVVLGDIVDERGRETERVIHEAGGRAAYIRADAGRDDDAKRLVYHALESFGGLDALVNNASAPYPGQALLSGWFEAVQVDLLGAMYCAWHAIEAMKNRGGAIVNISSTSAVGHGCKPSQSPGYDVAKSGVLRLTTMLAPLAAAHNIRVNCLAPDWVATPEVQEYHDSLAPEERVAQQVPSPLTPLADIADMVIELATNESLSGRVAVAWTNKPAGLIRLGDPGYVSLEPFEFQRT